MKVTKREREERKYKLGAKYEVLVKIQNQSDILKA
jgi:hypothetical protein